MCIRGWLFPFLLFLGLSAQGQFYAGSHPVSFYSKGTGGEMTLASKQMVSEYDATNRKLSIRMKTQGLTFEANAETQQVLTEVFQVDAFPLWQMEADLSQARPHPGGKGYLVPVVLLYHGMAPVIADAHLFFRETTDAVHMDLALNFRLDQLGIADPSVRFPKTANRWDLVVENARLMRR